MKTNYAQFLTYKQKVFCDEYLTDRNATAAALKAGYSPTTALSGYLMTLPKIQLYLRQQMDIIAEKAQVDHEMVLRELCKIAFGNMSNYFADDGSIKTMDKLSDDDKAALETMTVARDGKDTPAIKLRMYNKLAALDKIARHLNFYKPEEKQPERIYVYVGDEKMNEDDTFDAYRLTMEAYAAKEKAAERAEEDKEREWAEANFKGQIAVAASEEKSFEIPKNTQDIGEGMMDMTGVQDNDQHSVIPKNTEDIGEGMADMTFAHDTSTIAQDDSLRILIPKMWMIK